MIVQKVFGKTPDSDKVRLFSDWFLDNMNNMDSDDNEEIVGTMTIDFQAPTNSLVIQIETYSEEFAKQMVSKMDEIGFDSAKALGITREGGIQ